MTAVDWPYVPRLDFCWVGQPRSRRWERVQEPVAEPQQALSVFTHMLGEAGLDVSTMRAAGAWAVFVTFARVPFAVPQLPDADGLLYQLGTYSFSGEPAST